MAEKTTNILIVSLGILYIGTTYAFEYLVRGGDTLSEVVKVHFPGSRIYGNSGKIKDVLKLNPNLKNPDLILPNDKILLEKTRISASEDEEYAPSSSPSVVGEVEVDDSEWLTTLYYGARYTQFSQSGSLAGADLGVLLINEITFRTEYRQKDWSWGVGLNTYRFKYSESEVGSGSERLTHLNLYLAKKWFIVGLGVMEQPIFRNNLGSIEMDRQMFSYMKIGYLQKHSLTPFKNTNLNLKALFMFPLTFSSPNEDIDIGSASSIGLEGEIELERELYLNESYSLYLTWLTGLNYLKISEEVKWADQSGSVDINSYGIASSLGLRLKF
ncbi:MAG: LysM peptidoglycan-binding domain-containing protein [Bacteriovoracia bacterium]